MSARRWRRHGDYLVTGSLGEGFGGEIHGPASDGSYHALATTDTGDNGDMLAKTYKTKAAAKEAVEAWLSAHRVAP